MTSGTEHSLELDAVILGAGVAGLYQLHQLRQQGLRRSAASNWPAGGSGWSASAPPASR